MRRFIFVWLLFLGIFCSYAQNSIKGIVKDEKGEPLVFADVIFKNTSIGVITDIDGLFELQPDGNHKILQVSFLGFETREIDITNVPKFLEIILEEGNQLDEVILINRPKKRLKKRENPAYPIMRKLWEKRKENGLHKTGSYQYKKYSSIETGANNIDTTFIKTLLLKNQGTDDVLRLLKRNNDKRDNLYIPLHLIETVQNFYGNNKLGKKRSEYEAERKTGVKIASGFFFQRAGYIFNFIDVYKNSFQLFNTSFTSPVSKIGFATYDYVLHDSIKVGDKTQYKIYYFPRREADMAFEGFFTVEKPSYAIADINMRLTKANLNIVKSFYAEQSYNIVNDSVYTLKETAYEVEYNPFTRKEKSKSLYVNKKEIYTDYVFNQPKEDSFYKQENKTRDYTNQYNKSDDYWNKTNLDNSNQRSLYYINQMKENKKIKTISSIITILSSGYIPISKSIQYGKYWDLLSANDIEGERINLGLRTFKTIDDRFRATAITGYGFLDRRLKYGLNAKYLLSTKPRIITSATLSEDFEQLGGHISFGRTLLGSAFDSKFLLSRGNNFYLTDLKNRSLGLDYEFAKNIHLGLTFDSKRYRTASKKAFDISYDDGENILNEYNATEFNSYLLYTPNRQMFGLGVVQKSGRSIYPTIYLRYVRSQKGLLSNLSYQKVQFSYGHPFMMAALGIFTPKIQLGKTFGTVPITLLNPIPANQGISFSSNTFSLLNYYDLITDSYLIISANHNFYGFFLNRIPLVKKLKWRSIIFAKAALGTISNNNREANRSNITYNAPSDQFYLEYGFGFSNIGFGNFKIASLYFTWRGDLPNNFVQSPFSKASSNFGMRFNLDPKF